MKWRSVLRARYAFGAYAVAEGCSFAAHQNRVREMERAPRRVTPREPSTIERGTLRPPRSPPLPPT